MQQTSKPNSGSWSEPALLASEVAELHREKLELLEENARLKKGLEFPLARYWLPSTCPSCCSSCVQDEQ